MLIKISNCGNDFISLYSLQDDNNSFILSVCQYDTYNVLSIPGSSTILIVGDVKGGEVTN